MKSIRTEIIIKKPVSEVWGFLVDFDDYPSWNPFIHIQGKPVLGNTLENTMYLEGQKPQVFKPKIIALAPEKSFRWLGHLFVPGLFDGEHFFELEAVGDDKTKLVHGEYFSGLLCRPILHLIGEKTKAAFQKMNAALKIKAEKETAAFIK